MNKIIVSLVCLLAFATTALAGTTTFTWDASPTPEVEFYRLYQIHPSGESGILVDGIVDLTVIVENGSNWEGEYTYYVTANAWGDESIPSNLVSAVYGVPASPLNFSASKSVNGVVTFTWNASASTDIEFYTVYEFDSTGVPQVVANNVVGTSVSVDFQTSRTGVFEYYVTASSWGEESVPSNTDTTRFGKPNPPRNVNAWKNK